MYREKIRRSKDQLEFSLARAVEDDKNAFVDYTLHIYTLQHTFYKYINSKRRTKKNLHPLLDVRGKIRMKAEDRAEELNAIFASEFISMANCSQGTQPPELEYGDRE